MSRSHNYIHYTSAFETEPIFVLDTFNSLRKAHSEFVNHLITFTSGFEMLIYE